MISGTPNIQMSSITQHNSSIEHKNACASAENKQSDCRDQEDNRALGDPDISEEDRVVFNTVYHTAKEQEPSEKVNRHLELQRKNGLDTKYQNISPKTVTEMQEAICNVLTENLVSNINHSPVYSIMLDESTDITVEKKLSICVRYVNKKGKAETTFLCNVPLADGCAHTIVSTVSEQFEGLGIDLSKCTSLATDGAAVMMGKRSGVGVQMQSKYSPFCIQTHCIAHRLNLACTVTIKKDEYMVKFKDKFDALYHFITASHSRVSTLKRIQELLDEPELTIKQPHSIRWLGLKNAVEAVYETYASVLATLSKFAAEKNSVAKGLYKYFGNYKVALVIAFMLDIHTELGVLSQQFQKQNLLLSEAQPLIDGTLAKLELMSSVDGEGLRNMKSEINIADDVVSYKGEKLKHMDIEFERLRVAYIKNLRKNIKQRLRKEDGDILADFGKVLEPITVCNTEDQDSNDSLRHLANFMELKKKLLLCMVTLLKVLKSQRGK